jgi:hypothetical protein
MCPARRDPCRKMRGVPPCQGSCEEILTAPPGRARRRPSRSRSGVHGRRLARRLALPNFSQPCQEDKAPFMLMGCTAVKEKWPLSAIVAVNGSVKVWAKRSLLVPLLKASLLAHCLQKQSSQQFRFSICLLAFQPAELCAGLAGFLLSASPAIDNGQMIPSFSKGRIQVNSSL